MLFGLLILVILPDCGLVDELVNEPVGEPLPHAEEVPLTGATEIVERPVIVTADITTPTGMLRAFIILLFFRSPAYLLALSVFKMLFSLIRPLFRRTQVLPKKERFLRHLLHFQVRI